MTVRNVIGLLGEREVDLSHTWLLAPATGVEDSSFSKGTYFKVCRAACMGTSGTFYAVGDNADYNSITTSVIKMVYGADTLAWETFPTIGDVATGIVYEPVNKLIIVAWETGSLSVFDQNGVELWSITSAVPIYDIVTDASGFVYICGQQGTGQLDDVNLASVWKLQWNGTTIRYDVIAYYDTGDSVYGLAINSSGNVLVCGETVTSKNVWKLTSSLTLATGTASWLVAISPAFSCEWLSTGNFVVAGANTGTAEQVWVINATTSDVIWKKIRADASRVVQAITVDSSNNVYVIYHVVFLE